MAKTNTFSIFLIKEGKTIDDLFSDDRVYDGETQLSHLTQGAAFFLIDNPPKPPWWASYFALPGDIEQVQKGAIYVQPVGNRLFCICFGMVSHMLDDEAYEYDFGLRVTLNCIDPKKLKSTDTIETGPARRQRTQIPLESDLNYFDFDYESDVLKSLTGKVKEEYKHLFRHATGADNLRVGSTATLAGLEALCKEALILYQKNDFESAFPGLRNISPVKDPAIVSRLNDLLLTALRSESKDVDLMVPDLINYHSNVYASFAGAGTGDLYDEVYIGRYYEYLKKKDVDISSIEEAVLKKHYLCLADADESTFQRFALGKCIIFDTSLDDQTYHLREKQWYRVDQDYVAEMKEFLDLLVGDRQLPDYIDKKESDCNQRVAATNDRMICMDTLSISPIASNMIEPCDLYTIDENKRVFIHVKISTLSATLSHLFNQGANPIQILKTNKKSQEKLDAIIKAETGKSSVFSSFEVDDYKDLEVCFAVISRKDASGKSDNFPLFSRISLMRTMKALAAMSVRASYIFVKDASVAAPGKRKPRKPRKRTGPAVPF